MDHDPESVIGASSSEGTTIRADHSMVNQIRIVLPVSAYVIAAISAVAIIASGLALYGVDQVRMHEQLTAYTLNELKTGQISYLESELSTDQKLIQAYGIGKQCRRSK